MKVSIYSRCSTADQSVAMQLDELRDYCTRRGWEIFAEYSDEGVSGSKESRPALNRMLADARRRRFDCVLVYRYDRAARSLRQLVNLLGEFESLGLAFVSLHEGPAVDLAAIKSLRESGMSWDKIAAETGIARATLRRECRKAEIGLSVSGLVTILRSTRMQGDNLS